MSYSISLIVDLKNNSDHSQTENLIYDIGYNCNASNIYNDFELEGINNYVKKNNKIIILEFESIESICKFISFLKNIKLQTQTKPKTQTKPTIEYIYENNNILYATNKYLNSLDSTQHNKQDLLKKIEANRLKEEYKLIYNNLQ